MPRKAKGTTFVSDGSVYASVIIAAPRKRLARALPFVEVHDEKTASAWAAALQELVDALRAAGRDGEIPSKVDIAVQTGSDDRATGLERVRAGIAKLRADDAPATLAAIPVKPGALTIQKFGERWTKGELHTEYPDHIPEKKTADQDVLTLERYVYPVVGHIRLAAFTLRDAQEVMRRIPRERLSSTRRHVAQVMVRLCNLAVYPCQIIERSPLPKGFLPKVKTRPGAYLYPTEERALLSCVDTSKRAGVPLVYRLLYGFLAREGMRSDEARSLEWSDLDLVRGVVTLDINKTDDPRSWALDAGVVRALKWWKKRAPAGALVFDVAANHLADSLREHMTLAGIERPELVTSTAERRRMNVHGLRATFVTLSLANGKTETWVADRTGHRSSAMINRYRRVARTAAELRLGALTPLDRAIPEMRAAKTKRAA